MHNHPLPSVQEALALVRLEFNRNKIMLESDPRLPNTVNLVAGGPIKGSWWGHPAGKRIWRVLNEFQNPREVLTTRLVSGKVTFIHRSLWSDVFCVAAAKEDWQTKSLSVGGKALLAKVQKKRELRADSVRWSSSNKGSVGDAARELERRLLVHSDEIHTERGTHVKLLRTWRRWASTVRFEPASREVNSAMRKIDRLIASLNQRYGAAGQSPWHGLN